MRDLVLDPHPSLRLGVVEARVTPGPSPEALATLLGRGDHPGIPDGLGFDRDRLQPTFDAVRALLRHGGYKPAGRGKPASEYLAGVAEREPRLRSINNLVDVNNAVSLHTGLPMSILDGDKLEDPVRVGIAESGVRYVFNPAGQEIDVSGLLCIHHGSPGRPCANAVKDSMETKVGETTRSVVAFLYAPASGATDVETAAHWYGELLRLHCRGAEVETRSLDPS